MSKEFIEKTRGIYRPIRVLFDTPIYERALQTCWHVGSYKSQIALVAELLRLQQNNQLPSAVTAEDMTDLLVEESRGTLRVQLWEFEQEDFDDEVRSLLKLVWEVNTSMKMRDVEFEARRLLSSPETIPAQFLHPKIIRQAQKYSRSLTEQHHEAPSSKLLGPREVVMEVVPKVLQGFWLPPPNTSFNMPSQQLSKMAVGVTKAVEDRVSTALSSMLLQVTFSRCTRDNMVLSIQEKVRQGHTQDVLVKMLNCFAAEVLKTISDIAAGEICALFQPHSHTNLSPNLDSREHGTQPADMVDGAEAKSSPAEDVNEESGLEDDSQPIRETGSAVITAPPSPLNTSAEPLPNITVQSPTETEEQPTLCPEADSPPLPLVPAAEPPVTASVLDDENTSEEPSREPDSADKPPVSAVQDDLILTQQPVRVDESFNTTTEVKETKQSSHFFHWLLRNICCCFLPEANTETA